MLELNSVEEIVFYKSININGENQSAYWSRWINDGVVYSTEMLIYVRIQKSLTFGQL